MFALTAVTRYHAVGGSMHVEGMANIRICANNIQATLKVAVSSELKETMLISCDDLRKLRVIPNPKCGSISQATEQPFAPKDETAALVR